MKKLTMQIISAFILFTALLFPRVIEAKPYYEGKILTIIVGYAPGGGYDRMARLVSKHLPKHIPGKPVVLVQNMPGASSMIAANYLFNAAKPDGLTIGTFNRYATLSQLLKMEGVRFDLAKYAWVGSASVEAAVFTLRADLPFRTVDDLKKAKEPIFIGNTGEIDTGSQFAPLLKEFMGNNVKFVTYPQTADIMLALERKEVAGYGFTYTTAKPFIDSGLIRPLIRGSISAPGIENLPINEDLAKNKQVKTIISTLSAPDRLGRPYVAPPKTPDQTMKILRDAFAKLAQDPEAQAEAKRMKMELSYTPASEILKILGPILNQPPEVIAEVRKLGKF
jgi:tripartite-type tricarboxylate transporter receptor subunit TctC